MPASVAPGIRAWPTAALAAHRQGLQLGAPREQERLAPLDAAVAACGRDGRESAQVQVPRDVDVRCAALECALQATRRRDLYELAAAVRCNCHAVQNEQQQGGQGAHCLLHRHRAHALRHGAPRSPAHWQGDDRASALTGVCTSRLLRTLVLCSPTLWLTTRASFAAKQCDTDTSSRRQCSLTVLLQNPMDRVR